MFILTRVADAVGTITLNQPPKRNALSCALVEEMIAALADFQKVGVRAVVIRAAPLTPDVFERIQELRQRVYESADYREGVRAFHEKRKPAFAGK